jgi:hypothetical protein
MKLIVSSLLIVLGSIPCFAQYVRPHWVCIQAPTMYHDNEHCATLMMCTGGKTRKIKNVNNLKACPKCARPIYKSSGFSDVKRILGVKDKKQIVDSLGTGESTIKRPAGFTMRISGLPETKTVNMIEFFMNNPVTFTEDTVLTSGFYNALGLQFQGCKADTVRNATPHPVTGKLKKDFTIEYRGCAIVEKRDQYEDVSTYYYELNFISKETDREDLLDKVQLILKAGSK